VGIAVLCLSPLLSTPTAWALSSGEGEGASFCSSVTSAGYDLGANFDKVWACGPAPGASGTPGYGDAFESAPYGFQCTELADRFLWDVWGLTPVRGDALDGESFASTVHGAHPSVPLVLNGTAGQPYRSGDLVSFTGNSHEPDGHVAVVTASAENASGNGTVTIMEQDAAVSGQETLTVSDWSLKPAPKSDVTPYEFDALQSSPAPAAAPTLGLNNGNPDVLGFGSVRPPEVSLSEAGDTGRVGSIKWTSWGGIRATGTGLADWVWPGWCEACGSDIIKATVVAWDLHSCGGHAAYEDFEWFFPSRGQSFTNYRRLPDLCSGSIGEVKVPFKSGTCASLPDVGVSSISAFATSCTVARSFLNNSAFKHYLGENARFELHGWWCGSELGAQLGDDGQNFACAKGNFAYLSFDLR
jgi:hypothetical protein